MTHILNGGISVLFLLLWVVVGFFALRWLGQRFFSGPYRADVFALGAVVAFIIGAFGPFGHRVAEAPPAAPAPVAVNVPPPQPPEDKHALCKAVKSLTGTALGSVDVVGTSSGDKVTGQPAGFILPRNATLGVVGWIADGATKTPALGACLVIDGSVRSEGTAVYGVQRPDVATAYNIPVMASTGYTITLPAKLLTPGAHVVSVASVTTAGAAALAGGVHITVH